jgi:2,4-didehydro-3-deoxy-L-rhamnonate hydrolase
MKLASFHADGRDRIGFALNDGSLVDASEAMGRLGFPLVRNGSNLDIEPAILGGDPMLKRLRKAIDFAQAEPEKVRRFDADEVTWHPPLRRPSKIVCIALNNRSVDAMKIKGPTDHPAFFLKPSTSLTGHRTPIRLRRSYGLTHSEPELAVVIGRRLTDAAPEAVYDAIFGYTIVNDVTSIRMRDEDSFSFRYFRQNTETGEISQGEAHTSYAGRYKGSDSFGPCGPFVVTRDEIPDPHALEISCHLDDQLVARDRTRNYVWSVPAALSHISRNVTLLPGDIVCMGTAASGSDDKDAEVPSTFKADLQGFAGIVSISITNIGTLSNTVEAI